MQKQAIFQSRLLPYALVAPQLAIVLVFFYWPALQAVIQSFLLQDAFGLSTTFVWFENYADLFKDLATVRTDAEVGTVDDWEWTGPDADFPAWCDRFGWPRLASDAGTLAAQRRR